MKIAWPHNLSGLLNKDAAQRITERLGVDVDVGDFDSLMDGIVLPNADLNKLFLGGSTPDLIEPALRLEKNMRKEKQLSHPVNINGAIDSGFATCY